MHCSTSPYLATAYDSSPSLCAGCPASDQPFFPPSFLAQLLPEGSALQLATANYLYNRYLREGAPHEVSTPSAVLTAVITALRAGRVDSSLFDMAQKYVVQTQGRRKKGQAAQDLMRCSLCSLQTCRCVSEQRFAGPILLLSVRRGFGVGRRCVTASDQTRAFPALLP